MSRTLVYLLSQFLAKPGHAVLDAVGIVRARALFAGCTLGSGVRAYGHVDLRAVDRRAVSLGDRAFFLRGMIPTQVNLEPGGRISVGDDTGLNYGAALDASQSIVIGRRCKIASMVRICDHSGRESSPIVIGDDVWIAHGAIIEPGVTVGNGAVISAGSVVRSDVPPHSLAIGNPARAVNLDAMRPRSVSTSRESPPLEHSR